MDRGSFPNKALSEVALGIANWEFAENWWTDPINRQKRQPHEIIELPFQYHVNQYAKIQRLYEDGMSLREIEKRSSVSKTKLRETLLAGGAAIRSFKNGQSERHGRTEVMRSGNPPYGYAYLEGKLVVDPHEYKVLLEMHRRWRSGEGLRAICRNLDERGVKSRSSKSWKHNTIKQMIDRHEQMLAVNKEK